MDSKTPLAGSPSDIKEHLELIEAAHVFVSLLEYIDFSAGSPHIWAWRLIALEPSAWKCSMRLRGRKPLL
jgi:hypothetical protein